MVSEECGQAKLPAHRVIVLGASNVRIGVSVAIQSARQVVGQPLDFLAAIGFGRSYGIRSWVLGRSLEGILDCGLWPDLIHRSPLPTTALLTDIGNDILYDVPVRQIAEWIEECLRRLSAHTDRLVMTTLPVESVQNLDRGRFLVMRTILFPKCRLDLATAVQRAVELNDLIVALASRFQVRVVCRVRSGLASIPFTFAGVIDRKRGKIFFTSKRVVRSLRCP